MSEIAGVGDKKTATVTTNRVTRYLVRSGYDYGAVFIECGETSATVSTVSSFGSYGYHWSNTGPDPRGFLRRMPFESLASKFLGNDSLVFDRDAQEREMKREIIDQRKQNEMDKVTAREVWDEVQAILTNCSGNSEEFYRELILTDFAFSCLYNADHGSVHVCTMPEPQLVGFWSDIWVPLMNHLETNA